MNFPASLASYIAHNVIPAVHGLCYERAVQDGLAFFGPGGRPLTTGQARQIAEHVGPFGVMLAPVGSVFPSTGPTSRSC
jgi:hypothetical protein